MADIPVTKNKGGAWWMWLLGLLLLGALAWIAFSAMDNDDAVETDPVAVVDPGEPEPIAVAVGTTFGEILANPTAYAGQALNGAEVNVPDVPSDRGFWIEQMGERMFAILNDGPEEAPVDINQGQVLRIERGILREPSYLDQLPGEPLEAETRRLASEQPLFLEVNDEDVTILSPAGAESGARAAGEAP